MTELDDRLDDLKATLKRRSDAAIDRNIDALKDTVTDTKAGGPSADVAVGRASALTLGALADIATAYSEGLKVATAFVQDANPKPNP